MSGAPKVSVVVPVHDTAPWLERCVESIRRQTLRDIEIVLVENLSTDDSPAMCDAYAALDDRIRVLHLSQAGLSRARNAGLAVTTAPYVGFIDSDDYIEPDMFRLLYDAAVGSDAQIACCDLAYEEEGAPPPPVTPAAPVTVHSPEEMLCGLMLERISASACTKLFDRTLFDEVKFPLDVWFEDHRVVHEWVARCRRIACVEKVCYHYIQRDGSICHSFGPMKHYHFFLANAERFEFVLRQRLCDGRPERTAVCDKLVRNCLWNFREALRCRRPAGFASAVEDMRGRLARMYEAQAPLSPATLARLRRVVKHYRWYCLTHSCETASSTAVSPPIISG